MSAIETSGSGGGGRRQRLERWAELSQDLLFTINAEGYLTELNPAWEATFGWSREELMARPLIDYIHHADIDQTAAQLERVHDGDPLITTFENRFQCSDRGHRWLLWSATTDGISWFGVAKDITAWRDAEARLRASDAQYRGLFDRNPQPLWVYDKQTLRVLAVNDAACVSYGYTREEFLAMTILDLRAPAQPRFGDGPKPARSAVDMYGRPGDEGTAPRLRHAKKDGTIIDVEVTGSDLTFDGHAGRLVLALDVTERRRAAAEHELLAAIVGSSQDAILSTSAAGIVTSWNPAAERLYGYSEAEAVGRPLQELIVPEQALAESNSLGARVVTEQTISRFECERRHKDGHAVHISLAASAIRDSEGEIIGYSAIAHDISDRKAAESRRRAELDMLAWVGRIRDALDNDKLVLFAQPIVDLATGGIVQEELLLRMVGADGAIIAPGLFLPAAERYGLIEEIDLWVVGEAARLAATRRRVEINISGRSLGNPDLLAAVERSLHESGADPADVTIEITETALAQDVEQVIAFADKLSQIGCGFALDDFGTGYGSFTYLKRLPISFLKIDIDFVRELNRDQANRHVISAIVDLAHGFGQRTIAEGVEDAETLDLLRELGVDFVQGFHLGRPAPLGG